MSKAHIPPAVAIIGLRPYHFNLFERKKNWTNKGTDKQYVADSLYTLELVINDVCTKFQNPRSSS